MAKSSTGLEENVAGLLCYIGSWITGLVFFLIEKDSKYVKFHAMQSIVLFAAFFVFSLVIGFIPFVGFLASIVWIVFVVMWVICMVKAYRGEKYKVPGIGDLAEQWSA